MKTKIIVVTGGVYSSLGKGIVASSIGRILKEYGYKISMQKLDPYLNVDPGTLSPYQHGEVFVTKDGAETDLDLGHYERFVDNELSKYSSITSGRIYYEVLNQEREGKFGGKTVQVIPHITQQIQSKIKAIIKNDKPDFLIIEIGGTIGDIESLPFIEALRSFSGIYSRKNILFTHCAPLIKIEVNGEIKTKPTQYSIKNLMNLGIHPDILVLRTSEISSKEIKQKLSWTTDISMDNIFSSVDSKSIYDVPKLLFDQGIHKSIFSYFKITKKGSMGNWNKFLNTIHSEKKHKASIALVGKYTELPDAYLSVIESLKIASYSENVELKLDLINSETIDSTNYINKLKGYDGILVPGGFGERGIEGKILAAKYARENKIPYFGICLGMQVACLEFARNVLKYDDANSTEFNSKTTHKIFDIMDSELSKKLGGTLRLGNIKVDIEKNTLADKIYKSSNVEERHRHRYCFGKQYVNDFANNGFIVSGTSADGEIIEIMEMKDHPFFIGVQYHPEFQSRPLKPNPIFKLFIAKSKK